MTMTLPLMSRTVSVHAFQVESWFYKGRMTKKKKKKLSLSIHLQKLKNSLMCLLVSPPFSPPFSLFHALPSSARCCFYKMSEIGQAVPL